MKLKSFAYLKKTDAYSGKEVIWGKWPKSLEETFFEKNKTVKRLFNNFYFCVVKSSAESYIENNQTGSF